MLVVLQMTNRRALNRYTGLVAGALVAIFITFEAPISGMSMNPARSFGSALSAHYWHGLWIYFTAPVAGMLLAAEVYLRTHGHGAVLCCKIHHDNDERCIFRCRYGEPASVRCRGRLGHPSRRAHAVAERGPFWHRTNSVCSMGAAAAVWAPWTLFLDSTSQRMGLIMSIGLQARLLFPIGASAIFLGVYAIGFGESAHLAPGLLVGLLLLLLVVMATNVELFVARPLRHLLQTAQDLAQSHFPASPVSAPAGQMRELADGLNRLRDRMQEYEANLAQERARRQALEQSVRELEDRYALTVERANDGIWEWNVKSGAADFSLRWKAMLGLSETPLASVHDWQNLLHPEDRESVLLRIENHVDGLTPHIDEEYRLRQGDGQYRWVHSRGTAIRHATGKAHRVIIMDNDIHARKEIENALIQAAEGLSAVSGVDFFQSLMRSLSSILQPATTSSASASATRRCAPTRSPIIRTASSRRISSTTCRAPRAAR